MLESDFGGRLPDASRCLYSRWTGYLEKSEWQVTRSKLQDVRGGLIEVHTSGHIYADDIEGFVQQTQPGMVIPVHTFEPERFKAIHERVKILADGETWNFP
jgi:ribonuclease J